MTSEVTQYITEATVNSSLNLDIHQLKDGVSFPKSLPDLEPYVSMLPTNKKGRDMSMYETFNSALKLAWHFP